MEFSNHSAATLFVINWRIRTNMELHYILQRAEIVKFINRLDEDGNDKLKAWTMKE